MNKQVIITVLLALVTFVSCDSNKQRVTSPITTTDDIQILAYHGAKVAFFL